MDFSYFGLSEPVAEGIRRLGFSEPTRIQTEAIPHLLEGRDVLGKAESGAGKTLAYGVPLIERIDVQRTHLQALVVCPTRESAQQTAADLERLGQLKGVRVATITAGEHVRSQRQKLAGRHVVVGTAARVVDLMDAGFLSVDWAGFAVIDGFDRLQDAGLLDDARMILERLPRDRQTAIFTATTPRDLLALAKSCLRNPELVQTTPPPPSTNTVRQRAVRTKTARKMAVLERLLTQPGTEDDTFLVFADNAHQVGRIDRALWMKELSIASLSGEHDESVGAKVIDRFRRREIRILLLTDAVARTLEVDHVTHVINFDVPAEKDEYDFRAGRTARSSREADVTTLVGDEDVNTFQRLRRHLTQGIEFISEMLQRAAPAEVAPPPTPAAEAIAPARAHATDADRGPDDDSDEIDDRLPFDEADEIDEDGDAEAPRGADGEIEDDDVGAGRRRRRGRRGGSRHGRDGDRRPDERPAPAAPPRQGERRDRPAAERRDARPEAASAGERPADAGGRRDDERRGERNGGRGHRTRFDYKRWEEEQLNRPVELISDNWTRNEIDDADPRGYEDGDGAHGAEPETVRAPERKGEPRPSGGGQRPQGSGGGRRDQDRRRGGRRRSNRERGGGSGPSQGGSPPRGDQRRPRPGGDSPGRDDRGGRR
jgi:superfamily II DNA/RNA helicase